MTQREPILTPIPILDLRPTQITVGMHEVEDRRKRIRARKSKKIGEYLADHMIPVILGPKKRHYIIDHHHLSLALHLEKIDAVLVNVVTDLSMLDPDAFWVVLDHRALAHPYDAHGKRRDISDLPKAVTGLKDDPFRSLAGALRRVGAYAKDTSPFSEFQWADFLRRRMKRSEVEAHFARALKHAYELARGEDAHYLPGWCGPSDG